jgi:hypothetical protein
VLAESLDSLLPSQALDLVAEQLVEALESPSEDLVLLTVAVLALALTPSEEDLVLVAAHVVLAPPVTLTLLAVLSSQGLVVRTEVDTKRMTNKLMNFFICIFLGVCFYL